MRNTILKKSMAAVLSLCMAAAVPTAVSAEGVTLSLSLPTTWNTDALAKGISLYEEATGNKIEMEAIPDDQFQQLMLTRLATKTDVPDLMAGNPITSNEQTEMYFEELDGEWIAKIDPETLEKEYKINGKLYQAPYGSANALGIIYNKQILEENGIDVPIMNYSELMDACEKLKAAGVTPFSISNKEGWTAQILILGQWQAKMTEEEMEALKTGKLGYPEIDSLKTIFGNALSLKEKGYINEDYMSTTMDMSIEDVATGECAMTPAGDWSYVVLQQNFPDAVDNVGMIPSPMWEDGTYLNIGTSSKYMWVTKDGKSDNAEEAEAFVNFLMSDETIQAMFEIEKGICCLEGVEVEQNSWDNEMVGYSEKIPYASQNLSLSGFQYGDIATTVQQLFGGKTVDQALEYWYDDMVQQNKASKTEGF